MPYWLVCINCVEIWFCDTLVAIFLSKHHHHHYQAARRTRPSSSFVKWGWYVLIALQGTYIPPRIPSLLPYPPCWQRRSIIYLDHICHLLTCLRRIFLFCKIRMICFDCTTRWLGLFIYLCICKCIYIYVLLVYVFMHLCTWTYACLYNYIYICI
jgi:hypothetical protein